MLNKMKSVCNFTTEIKLLGRDVSQLGLPIIALTRFSQPFSNFLTVVVSMIMTNGHFEKRISKQDF